MKHKLATKTRKKTGAHKEHSVYAKRLAKQHRDALKALASVPYGVAFCGSARTRPGNPYYDKNVEAAAAVAQLGVPIFEGGGPGNMEASAKGARLAGQESIALSLRLEGKEVQSQTHAINVVFEDFSPRIDTFRLRARLAMVFFPGGIGTLHEAMSMIDNIMQKKAPVRPIIFFEPLADAPYWDGLFAWLHNTVIKAGLLRLEELHFVHIVKSVDELVALIRKEKAQLASGPAWVEKFPTSVSVDDLVAPFKENTRAFLKALADAGATVEISATFRPPERAFLMHYAYRIARQGLDPAAVPVNAKIDIDWVHRTASGKVDLAASRNAAEEMVQAYGIVYKPALNSNHTLGLAIDMTISWEGSLTIALASGQKTTIDSGPRTGQNSHLHEVGKSYQVLKMVSDPPHWSYDAH